MLAVIRVIWSFIFWSVILFVITLSLANAFSERPDSKLPFRTYVVQSGSMEPTIMTGDLIFIRRNRSFGIKDIITFRSPKGDTITHRIVKTTIQPNGSIDFITKGDNNEDEDQFTTPLKSVLGVYWFSIPKIGYGLVYIRSFMGIVISISLLLGWIVSDMVWKKLNKQAQISVESTGK